MKKFILALIILYFPFSILHLNAQVGEYRNVFAVGVSGGYALNTADLLPTVPQVMHGGYTLGITGRYTSEKYFSTICSLQMELNVAQLGWKEQIETIDGEPVINPETETAEEFQRDITYVQIPLLAHLAWGKERHGINAFICAGPQIGFVIGDAAIKNYENPFIGYNFPGEYSTTVGRINSEVEQETLPLDNKIDYGITAGAGIEWDIKKIGRFSLEGRYYYGLGNLFNDTKTDEFAKSHNQTIVVKLSYLRDL